jgi:K+-transporting ATPase A subunit
LHERSPCQHLYDFFIFAVKHSHKTSRRLSCWAGVTMNLLDALQYLLFVIILTASVKPLGGYMQRVFTHQRTALDRLCVPVERLIYRIAGVDASAEMNAAQYAAAFIVFGSTCTLFLYAVLRLQRFLPWYFPAYQTTPLTPDLAFNTAVSFSTTTTWQAYFGEIIFGGLGTGFFGMVMTAAVAVFLSGLMIGRTPEYLGRRSARAKTRWWLSMRSPAR